MTVLVLIETVLLAVLSVLVAGLLRAYGTVLARLHRLDGGGAADAARSFELLPLAQPGTTSIEATHITSTPITSAPITSTPASVAQFSEAHDITGETLAGELVSARVIDTEHDTLLLFLSSGCSSCEVFWSELAGPVSLPPRTRLLVVTQDGEVESPHELTALASPHVDVILSSRAWSDYGVPGSPHVVFVDGALGRVRGEGTGQSMRQVSELLARSTGDALTMGGRRLPKNARDAEQEAAVDRELFAAGIVPGDPRLYGASGNGRTPVGEDRHS